MKRLLSIAAVFLLGACASAPPTPSATPPDAMEITRVVSTTSFGMCVGYCTTRLEITDEGAKLYRESRGGRGVEVLPTTSFMTSLTLSEWREIQDLASRADLTTVPDVVGCPDCADGGAESLTIETANGSESVSFEFRADLPAAQPLLDRVRALRDLLTPREE